MAVFASEPRLWVWVLAEEQYLLGFASLTFAYSTWDASEYAHLDCLYLQEQARSKGFGLKLLQTALEFATSKNSLNLQWETPIWNADAIRFYQRLEADTEEKVRFFLQIKK